MLSRNNILAEHVELSGGVPDFRRGGGPALKRSSLFEGEGGPEQKNGPKYPKKGHLLAKEGPHTLDPLNSAPPHSPRCTSP